MIKYKFSKKIAQLEPSPTLAVTSKAKAMLKKGVDVVNFGAGEPDFDTPENVKASAELAIRKGFTKYTHASGTEELRAAIAGKLMKENSLSYSAENIVVSCGAKHSLFNVFQVLCSEADEVVVISPYWVSYVDIVNLSGAKPKIVRTDEKNDYVPDIKSIEKAISPRTKAIIINSPSNPTGAIFRQKELADIAGLAVSKGIFLISDEIYEKLLYNGEKHVSVGALGKDVLEHTVTVNGVSKSHSMTGWRIGYAAAPLEIIKKIAAFQSHSTSNPTSISQAAALEAIEGPQDDLEKMRKEFENRRNYMVERVNSIPNISCFKPKGAFYVFCNISLTGIAAAKFAERLLEEAKVACVPGEAFGSDKHVRFSFATGMDVIKKGIDRLESWMKAL